MTPGHDCRRRRNNALCGPLHLLLLLLHTQRLVSSTPPTLYRIDVDSTTSRSAGLHFTCTPTSPGKRNHHRNRCDSLSAVALLFDFISCGSDASQHLSLLHTPSSIAPPFALRKLIRLTAWTARACASYRNETALAEGARIYSRSFLSLQGLLSLLHLFWSAIEEEGRPQ